MLYIPYVVMQYVIYTICGNLIFCLANKPSFQYAIYPICCLSNMLSLQEAIYTIGYPICCVSNMRYNATEVQIR